MSMDPSSSSSSLVWTSGNVNGWLISRWYADVWREEIRGLEGTSLHRTCKGFHAQTLEIFDTRRLGLVAMNLNH